MKKGIAKIGDEIIAVVETDEVKVIIREENGMRKIEIEEKQKKEIQLIDIRPRARPTKRKSA